MTEKRFQQLCAALLAHELPGVRCFPVGQADGGRDMVQQSAGRVVIYQVKWSSKRLQDPFSWLKKAVLGEEENIVRLASEGAEAYYLMTCVAGTSVPGRGSMDKVDALLGEVSERIGIPMHCLWQSDLDARVDTAPRELKWAYADMLVGHDLIRYLIEADRLVAQDNELYALLLKVIATQWYEDAKVKFRQTELHTHDLASLFVDVEAVRTSAPARAVATGVVEQDTHLGGTARYLLNPKYPLTLVRGDPGQGKSTLGQYLCQVHRAEYLWREDYLGDVRPELTTTAPRLPLRVDLRDYALWMEGIDPFGDPETAPMRSKARARASVEAFLAAFLHTKSGGSPTTIPTVNDILSRLPLLIVLDGLDEVAATSTRERVVMEIEEFSARLGVNAVVSPQLVVTTRPNSSQLAEPSRDRFETISLTRLSPSLRERYLHRWADVQGIHGADRRALVRTYNGRSTEPHIAQLADNPMQLTILLYLMQKRGDSVPLGRTDLYEAYMETFLDREATKSDTVHQHRADLEEVTAYLGWHLQGLAELNGTNGQLSVQAIRREINHYLFEVDKDPSLVDALFTAVTDRVWALTSKVQGTFEFDVQPVREYFAAKFLFAFAGARLPKSALLRELVRRPYWLNTGRFFAGFANVNELSGLLEGLAEEFEANDLPAQIRVAAWSLLADGVFAKRPRTQANAVRLLEDDLSVRLLTRALAMDPSMAALPTAWGGSELVAQLRVQIEKEPGGSLAAERAALAARVSPNHVHFDEWWQPRMEEAAGGPDEVHWLRVGESLQGGLRLPTEIADRLAGDSPEALVAMLNAGVTPTAGGDLENRLLHAVAGGLCSDAEPIGTGHAADVARFLAPQRFIRAGSRRDVERIYVAGVGHPQSPLSNAQRTQIGQRLELHDPRYRAVRQALRPGRGQRGTTSMWGNTARAAAAVLGPCWLAAEIAVIGAATDPFRWRTGGDITPGSDPLGPDPDYGRLLKELRTNRNNLSWWMQMHRTHADALSRGTWALALLTVGSEDVVRQCLSRLDEAVLDLPAAQRQALCQSSSRLGASQLGCRVSDSVWRDVTSELSGTTLLLLAHHHPAHQRGPAPLGVDTFDMAPLTELQLGSMSAHGSAAWPAVRALSVRLADLPSAEVLAAMAAQGSTTSVRVPELYPAPLPDELIRKVLDRPADYPFVWVLEAAGQHASRHTNLPLAKVAADCGWFAQ